MDDLLLARVTEAIQNPGAIVHRAGDLELKEHWAARAVLKLLELGLLAGPRPPSVLSYAAAVLIALVVGLGIGSVLL